MQVTPLQEKKFDHQMRQAECRDQRLVSRHHLHKKFEINCAGCYPSRTSAKTNQPTKNVSVV